jgi:hypothetical protein
MTPQPSCIGELLPLGEGDFPKDKGTWLPQSSCPCFCPKVPKEHTIEVVGPRRTLRKLIWEHMIGVWGGHFHFIPNDTQENIKRNLFKKYRNYNLFKYK